METQDQNNPPQADQTPAVAAATADPHSGVKRAVLERFPDLAVDEDVKWGVGFRVPPDMLLGVAQTLKELPGVACNYLSNITAVDFRDHLQVVYHLLGVSTGSKVVLKVDLPVDQPEVESVVSVWPTADWHEREAWDLLGVRFRNHPNLKRILLWEGYDGHPLRKDFVDKRPKRERLIRQR